MCGCVRIIVSVVSLLCLSQVFCVVHVYVRTLRDYRSCEIPIFHTYMFYCICCHTECSSSKEDAAGGLPSQQFPFWGCFPESWLPDYFFCIFIFGIRIVFEPDQM